MMHGPLQKIDGRNEIGVENGDDLAGRGLQSVLQRAGFVAVPVVAMDVFDRQPGGADIRPPGAR